jgi:hypothetical protein
MFWLPKSFSVSSRTTKSLTTIAGSVLKMFAASIWPFCSAWTSACPVSGRKLANSTP